MKREGGREGSLVELGKEGENRRQIIQNSSCLHRKIETLNCFARKFKHIYCKYLHGE